MQDSPPLQPVHTNEGRPLVVCPLEFERGALRKLGLESLCDLHCCGPGAEAVTMWVQRLTQRPRLVILAGLAGALDPQLQSGSAHAITSVIDEAGQCISRGQFEDHSQSLIGKCTIVSASASVTSPCNKDELFHRTGASLVDLESWAFATCARQAQWPWLIIRGVSDRADESLPHNIDTWVDRSGRARAGVIAQSILKNPFLLRRLVRLRRHGMEAMADVARLIRQVADRRVQWIQPGETSATDSRISPGATRQSSSG